MNSFTTTFRELITELFEKHYPEIFIRTTTLNKHLKDASPFGYDVYVALVNTKIDKEFTTSKYRVDDWSASQGLDNREAFIKDLIENFSFDWLIQNINIRFNRSK